MGRNESLPFHIYVNVLNSFLGPNTSPGVTPGVWHGIYSRPGQVILCHVMLETGAHWSGLPLHAISTTLDFSEDWGTLMPWCSMGERAEVWHSEYLEGLPVEVLKPKPSKGRHTGLVVDWANGYSRYPQEHKPLGLIALDSGQFSLLPNNFVIHSDKHFTDETKRNELLNYRRGETTYWEKRRGESKAESRRSRHFSCVGCSC